MSLELDQAKTALVVIDMTKGVVSLGSLSGLVSSDLPLLTTLNLTEEG